MKKTKVSAQGFVMEHQLCDGFTEISMNCTDASTQFDKTFTGLNSKLAEQVTEIFETGETANEVKSKLQAIRLL